MLLLANVSDPRMQPPHSRKFWVVFGVLAIGQLFALALLCTHQVRKAEARHDEAMVQQTALSDCLQYIAGSTVATCIGGGAALPAGKHALAGAVPVSFSHR